MRRRILAVAAAVGVLLVLVAVRIVRLTLAESPRLAARARDQQHDRVRLDARRGVIVDRHGETLASSVERPSIYVRPRQLPDHDGAIAPLAVALDLDPGTVGAKLGRPARFVWLKRAVSPRERAAIRALRLSGIGEVPERRRFYPHGSAAAHVVGLAGVDLQGLEGVELYYDRDLRALSRTHEMARDARGRAIAVDGVHAAEPEHGASVQLTLDLAIQDVVERALAEGVAAARARAGTAIVLDPENGEILALANVPTFDPNARVAPLANRRNRAVTDVYEPGSTLKALTAAAAVEAGVVEPGELVFCEEGRWLVGRRAIHDHHPHGWLTFAEVVQVSSNIGFAKVAARLGPERLHAFFTAAGIGRATGADLPGEVHGLLRPPERWRPIDLATASFGQGVAVTPLQLVRAFAAIANGGRLVRPHVALRALGADGTVLWEHHADAVTRVMRSETARAVTAMLERVVGPGGTGTRAAVAGLRVAGKTGTAQKVDPETGRYSPHARVSSFIGFAPAEAPRVVVLVSIDEPKGSTYGGIVAAPIFREITSAALDRLGVPLPPAAEWRAARARQAPPAVPPPSGVPSFLGLSKRDAVALARDLGWLVRVDGTGYVTGQTPPPGARVAPGKALALTLASAGDTL